MTDNNGMLSDLDRELTDDLLDAVGGGAEPLKPGKRAPGTRRRRSSRSKMQPAVKAVCPQCGKIKLPHRVCPDCGYYDKEDDQ